MRAMLDLDEKILCRQCSCAMDALAWPLEEALVDERFEFLDHVWTVYAYGSPLRELLHGVKYSRKDYLLNACRETRHRTRPSRHFGLLVTMPYSPSRSKRLKLVKRHFNQVEILAEILETYLTPPVEKSFLIKHRPIPSQTALSQHERAINVYGAFKLRRPSRALGRSFLLLDDVLTTGTTANEAARLLKLHGAKRVDFLGARKDSDAFSEKQF